MKNYSIVALVVGLVGAIVWTINASYNLPKTAFVTTQEIFDKFAMTVELDRKLNQIQNQRNNYLDSLKVSIGHRHMDLQNTPNPDPQKIAAFEKAQENYLLQEDHILNENNQLAQTYNEQIWKQLNQYIKEYGESNNYQYIYGASGAGNLMYAKSSEDITKEVIKYANDRYEGDL